MLMIGVWILLVAATVLAAGAAALAVHPGRQAAALLATVLLTSGLLWWLAADIAVLAWLGPGTALAWLVTGIQPVTPVTPVTPVQPVTPAPRTSRHLSILVALPGVALGAWLILVVVQVDWRPLPPSAPVALGAEFGGRLVSEDAVLWLGSALLLVLALVAMAWSQHRQEPVERVEAEEA